MLAKLLERGTPTVYLSGPILGVERHNFPAFTAAAAHLRALGCAVISPHEQGPEASLADLVAAVPLADAVVVLPGWRGSPGSAVEVIMARALDMPVIDYREIRSRVADTRLQIA